jgi:hypothetical protein
MQRKSQREGAHALLSIDGSITPSSRCPGSRSRADLLGIGQFRDTSTQVVVTPAEYKSGDMIYPYANAK